MTFGYWPVLLALFVPLGLIVWVWLQPGGRVVLPQDFGRQSAGRFWRFGLNVFQMLPCLLLAVAVLLLAGPRQLSVPQEKRVLTNIEFCLDLSGSMMAPFGEETRYDAAVAAIAQFVDFRPGDAYGLTLFGQQAVGWIPLTQDPSAFKRAAPFIRPEQMMRSIGGGTMIGMALRQCRIHLEQRDQGDRMILLVSDGASADLSNGQDEVVARELQNAGIVVYGVHIGEGEMPAEVAAICTITGGTSFSAGDEMALRGVFQRIDQMQTVKLERAVADIQDFYWPFCLTGLVALIGYVLSSYGWRYTPW
jgi:Ca-activated chloride channel family protein